MLSPPRSSRAPPPVQAGGRPAPRRAAVVRGTNSCLLARLDVAGPLLHRGENSRSPTDDRRPRRTGGCRLLLSACFQRRLPAAGYLALEPRLMKRPHFGALTLAATGRPNVARVVEGPVSSAHKTRLDPRPAVTKLAALASNGRRVARAVGLFHARSEGIRTSRASARARRPLLAAWAATKTGQRRSSRALRANSGPMFATTPGTRIRRARFSIIHAPTFTLRQNSANGESVGAEGRCRVGGGAGGAPAERWVRCGRGWGLQAGCQER